jgi:hypothetical protein
MLKHIPLIVGLFILFGHLLSLRRDESLVVGQFNLTLAG